MKRVMGLVAGATFGITACSPEAPSRAAETAIVSPTDSIEQETVLFPASNEPLTIEQITSSQLYPEAAGFNSDFFARIEYAGRVLDLHTNSELSVYEDFAKASLEFLSDLPDQLPTFTLNFDFGNNNLSSVDYTPARRNDTVSTMLLVPGEYASVFPPIAQTTYLVFDSSPDISQHYSRSVSLVVANNDVNNDYFTKTTSYRIFVEACQSLISPATIDHSTGTVAEESLQLQGQELLCNSLGLVYASARAGYSFSDYVKLVENDTIEITGLSIPTLILPESLYGKFIEFAQKTASLPL